MIKPVKLNDAINNLNPQPPVNPAKNPVAEPKIKNSAFDNTVDQVKVKPQTPKANTVSGIVQGTQTSANFKHKVETVVSNPSPLKPPAGHKLNTIV
jgi:hypothetical protein